MTKKKSNTQQIKKEDEAPKLDKINNEKKLLKPRKKIVKRIVEIEEAVCNEANNKEKKHVDGLYKVFSLKAEAIPLLIVPKIPDKIKNDFLLKRLISDYEEKQSEYQRLVRSISRRWESCHRHADYYDHLAKLLTDAINTLTDLNKALDIIHPAIIKRIDLLSFKQIEPHHTVDAQNKLISSLDSFILSLSVLQFNSMVYPQATYFKDRIIASIEALNDRLCNSTLWVNSNTANELMSHLFAHLGLKKGILGIFSNNDSKLICYKEISPLIHTLFQPNEKKYTPQEAENQVLAYYDLAARLELSPIHDVKKYEILYCCQKNQENQIIKKNEELINSLNQLCAQLQEIKRLFVGIEYESLTALKEANTLTTEINELISHLKLNSPTDPIRQLNPDKRQLTYLLQFTQLQEESIQKLSAIEQQANTFASKTRNCVLRLVDFYGSEHLFLINGLKDAVKQATCTFGTQAQHHSLSEIEKANQLVNDLYASTSKIPLNSIKTQTNHKIDRLMGYVNEFKTTLGFEWAKYIFGIFQKKYDPTPFKLGTPHNIVLMKINFHKESYKAIQLSPDNPFQCVLNEITEECNQLLTQLINHFSKLDKTSGEDLNLWVNTIKNLYQRTQDGLLQRNTSNNQALIIESRLHSDSYRACLEVISTIDKKFIGILQRHLKTIVLKEENNELWNNIIKNPKILLQKNELSIEVSTLLDQLNPVLVKLFALSKELHLLNTSYINVHLNLCTENNYINQLLAIAISHLDKDGREFYSKGFVNADRFIEWLHIKVYKPLLHYYMPKVQSHTAFSEPDFDTMRPTNPDNKRITTNLAFFSIPKTIGTSTSKELGINTNPVSAY